MGNEKAGSKSLQYKIILYLIFLGLYWTSLLCLLATQLVGGEIALIAAIVGVTPLLLFIPSIGEWFTKVRSLKVAGFEIAFQQVFIEHEPAILSFNVWDRERHEISTKRSIGEFANQIKSYLNIPRARVVFFGRSG